jgi:hypothetical protein
VLLHRLQSNEVNTYRHALCVYEIIRIRGNKSNSSRDEMYEKNSLIHLDTSQNKLNISSGLDQIQGYKINWVQYVN